MSAIPQSSPPRFVSERILEPLRQVARRQWTVLATQGVLLTLLASLGLLLAAVLVMGRFDHVPMAVRIPVAVLVWSVIIALAIRFLRPALGRRTIVDTALDVERRLKPGRDVQERISSSVELSRDSDTRYSASPVLVEHLVRQAETDAAGVDPKVIAPADRVVKLGLLLLPLLGLWVGLIWWLPRERVLLPMFNLLVPWKTSPGILSHIAVDPGDKVLSQGDNLDIAVRVNADTAAVRAQKIEHATLTTIDPAGLATTFEMQRTGPRDFAYSMQALQKGFRYRISTDDGDSGDYQITVNPRPSIEQLDLRYDYPAYTHLDPKVDNNNQNGAIDALQGTRVTVSIHCPNELTAASGLQVTTHAPGAQAASRMIPLVKSPDGLWQAQLTLVDSGEYAIKLTNTFNLTNRDDQPRSITARYDERPTITIVSPSTAMTVRPDDQVPVQFTATDDFGVDRVDALVQVEGANEPQSVEVKLRPGDRRAISDRYTLDIAKTLAASGHANAQELTYWLKGTDNRNPDPQTAESAHQTLHISAGADGVKTQQDEKKAHDLIEAIRKAAEETLQEKDQAAQFSWIGQNEPLNDEQKQTTEKIKDRIEKTSGDLTSAAAEHHDDSFSEIAAKARTISEKLILASADDVAKLQLHSDSLESRKVDSKSATSLLTEAHKQLEALLKEAQKQAQNVETADKLSELAKDQQKIAEQQAAQPNKPADPNQQNQVSQKTQQAVSQDQALQNEKAREDAARLAQLLNQVDQIQKQQEAQEKQVQKQAENAEAQQHSTELAKKQEELNKKVETFKGDDKAAIEKANAQTPQPQQEQNIVNELNQNQIAQAANEQRQAAQQLENAANQLQNKAADNNLQPNADQQTALNQDQQQAQQAQQQSQQAQQESQQAKQAGDHVQQASQQAQQAQNANNADQKKNAAQQAAQAAQQAAQVAAQIGEQAKKTQQQADAAKQDAHADAQQAAQAASQAAQQAQADAQQAAKDAQDAQQAAANGDAQAAAADAQKAAQDAQQAAQAEQNAADQVAQVANKELEHAKGELLQQQKEQSAQAAAEAHELAKEQQALADATQAQALAAQQAQQGAEPAQQAAAEQKQVAAEAQHAEAAAGKLAEQAKEHGDAELAHRAEAAAADLKQAAEDQHAAAAAEAQGHPEQAAGQQEKAENALAQAEQALRGEAPQADAGKPDAGQDAGKADAGKPDAGQADAGKPDAGQGEPGKPEAGQGQAQAAEPHPGEAGQGQPAADPAANAQQALAQAAEHAQEAIAAQQQAAQGNAAASQQAAQALAQAAQELAQATQPGNEPGQDPGNEPGTGQGEQEKPSPTPGQGTPTKGLAAQDGGAQDGRPESVAQMGISASDWAKLGKLQQSELMNAAQQSGPPGYQAMVKNYYVRLAHMQAQAATR